MRKKAFGIPSKFLFDFFKESAFRWSHSSQGIYKPLLRILESHPLIRIYPETKRKFVIPKENPS